MKSAMRGFWTSALLAGLALATTSYAQMGQGMMGGRGGPGPGSQQMSRMMHDMSGEMTEMSDAMAKGTMTPEAQKRMAEQMKEMAGIMERMSGMMGRGMMMNPETQKQMDQMRMRMDEMMKEPAGAPRKK
jgi:Asp-tRNA(Asn)/Glu-tRNA(Gln) amidotransferase C subunit